MSQPQSRGTLESCPCPWPGCGFKNDFSDAPLVESGNVFSCDKCKRMIEIVRKQPITVLYVRATTKVGGGLQRR